MAKKPSGKRRKRPVEQSAVKGGGIMSLNKSNTSPFMKVIIVIIIISMVTLFFAGGVAGIVELFKPVPKAPVVDPIVALKQQYDPQLSRFDAMLASDPTSYTVLVSSGNARFDYALALTKLVSATATAAIEPAAIQWAGAADAFKKAVKANKDAPSGVGIDYSITLYYSGETTQAIKIATGVVKKDPTFAPAHYNLGIFFEAIGDKVSAIAAYQRYLALDPEGKNGDPNFVKTQLKTLGAPEKASGSAIPTGSVISSGSAVTTP
ncbi:MAG: tetratricopeptide repeat protein [Coriobacteriia bacterium]|nr:tetratricopeptide repeat protein [Coriobacteriia bacterium]